jgi:hypothetical protein
MGEKNFTHCGVGDGGTNFLSFFLRLLDQHASPYSVGLQKKKQRKINFDCNKYIKSRQTSTMLANPVKLYCAAMEIEMGDSWILTIGGLSARILGRRVRAKRERIVI